MPRCCSFLLRLWRRSQLLRGPTSMECEFVLQNRATRIKWYTVTQIDKAPASSGRVNFKSSVRVLPLSCWRTSVLGCKPETLDLADEARKVWSKDVGYLIGDTSRIMFHFMLQPGLMRKPVSTVLQTGCCSLSALWTWSSPQNCLLCRGHTWPRNVFLTTPAATLLSAGVSVTQEAGEGALWDSVFRGWD